MTLKSLLQIICLVTLALLAGCAPAAKSAGPFTDDAGRSVNLKGSEKIVSLAPSNTEVLYALGLGDRVVGVTEFDDYPPEVKTKPKVGGFSDVDAEKVVSIGPDLILAGNIHVAKVVPSLEKLGQTVYVVDPKNVDDVLARLETIGQMTGKDREAKELRAQLEKRLAAVDAKVKDAPKPRVFWMLGDGLFTAGPGSFVDDVIRRAGGTNIAADAKTPWPELSMEAVLKADPEVIVIPGASGPALAEKLKADPVWQKTTAVKNRRFVFIADENIVARPGPRVVDGLEALAKGLHPEQFK